MIKILCILIVLIKSKLTKEDEKIIKIPFKTQQSEITTNNLIQKLLENEIYIEIEVGIKLQKIPIYIKFDSYIFFYQVQNYQIHILMKNYLKLLK